MNRTQHNRPRVVHHPLSLIRAAGRIAILLLLTSVGQPQRAHAEVTAEQVENAIARGIAYLRSAQSERGGWQPEYPNQTGGLSSLCTLAMLSSGVEVGDPSIQQALAYLRPLEPQQTYSVALQTLVLCQVGAAGDLTRIQRNVGWLEKTQVTAGHDAGAWGYDARQTGKGDPSNTQFALLALAAAEERGVKVDPKVFARSQTYWVKRQKSNGGWTYSDSQNDINPRGSMTCAGIASLVICGDQVGRRDASVEGESIHCCGRAAGDGDPVEKGLEWLGNHFAVRTHPGTSGSHSLFYYLYALERVGRMTGRRLIGGHDWYRAGAEHLVEYQDKFQGFWVGVGLGENDRNVSTSFALLFLAKGKRQVVIGRLRHGDPQAARTAIDWQRHADGLRQLVRRLERQWGRDLTWQTFDLAGATTEDLLQTPVMVISGSGPLRFSDDDKTLLKNYLDQGGSILFEANAGDGCGPAEPFEQSVRALCEQWFPSAPLEKLPPSHPVWSAEGRVDPGKLGSEFWLYGVQACCRTTILYSPISLGCRWELSDPTGRQPLLPLAVREQTGAAAQLGQNIIAYATGRELKEKLDVREVLEPTPDAAPDRGTVRIAKLALSAGGQEAQRALPHLAEILRRQVPIRIVSAPDPVAIDAQALQPYPIVWMHGRTDFTLSAAERDALRTFLENGGVLLADAICGSTEFADAFRRELAAVLPASPLRPMPPDHEAWTAEFGGFHLSEVTLRRPSQGAGGSTVQQRRTAPVIEMASTDGVAAVFLSPYDLSCALESPNSIQCPGYDTQDAAKIGINLILFALQQ